MGSGDHRGLTPEAVRHSAQMLREEVRRQSYLPCQHCGGAGRIVVTPIAVPMLRQFRESIGVSREQLGDALGLGWRKLARLEGGFLQLRFDHLDAYITAVAECWVRIHGGQS